MNDLSATAVSAAPLPVRVAARALDVAVLVGLDLALGSAIGFGWDFLVLGSLMVLAYFTLGDALVGATPGKLALGLRVVGPDGGRPTLSQALARESFTLVGSVPLVGPIVALGLWVWFSIEVRRTGAGPHDRLAGGTRVVRAR